MLQQQLADKDVRISQLQQQLVDQSKLQSKIDKQRETIQKQKRKLEKQQAQPAINDVHIISMKQQVSGLKDKLAVQQQQYQHQQQQLQQCLQQQMQLSAENAKLRSQLQASQLVNQSSYDGLMQPVWFQGQPTSASSSDAEDLYHDLIHDDLDLDQVSDCSVMVVPLIAAKASDGKATMHSIITRVAAESADAVVQPDTPAYSTPQLHRTSSSCSSNGSMLGANASVSSSTSSFFSWWWPTTAAAPADATVTSRASSCNSTVTSKHVYWQPLMSAAKSTSKHTAVTNRRCRSHKNSSGSILRRPGGLWPESRQAAAPANTGMTPSNSLHRSYVDFWW